MSQCHECENEAVAQGYQQTGPRRSMGEWVPMCARCIGAGMARKVKALTAAEEQHAAATRQAKQANRSLLDGAVLPGGETWGVQQSRLGFSSDGEAAMAGKAKRTNAPSTIGAGWGAPPPRDEKDGERGAPIAEPTIGDARALRDDAMHAVEEAADAEWKSRAWDWLLGYLAGHAEFFPDDVWAAGMPVPRERRAFGPLIAKASKAGLIVPTDQVRPRKRGHATPAMVWRSTMVQS